MAIWKNNFRRDRIFNFHSMLLLHKFCADMRKDAREGMMGVKSLKVKRGAGTLK